MIGSVGDLTRELFVPKCTRAVEKESVTERTTGVDGELEWVVECLGSH